MEGVPSDIASEPQSVGIAEQAAYLGIGMGQSCGYRICGRTGKGSILAGGAGSAAGLAAGLAVSFGGGLPSVGHLYPINP